MSLIWFDITGTATSSLAVGSGLDLAETSVAPFPCKASLLGNIFAEMNDLDVINSSEAPETSHFTTSVCSMTGL